MLAVIDRASGAPETSPETARAACRASAACCSVRARVDPGRSLRGSRRACRYVALALAAPVALTAFGYYAEVGYLAVSVVVFPLLLHAIATRGDSHTPDIAGKPPGLAHRASWISVLLGLPAAALARVSRGAAACLSAFRFSPRSRSAAFYLGYDSSSTSSDWGCPSSRIRTRTISLTEKSVPALLLDRRLVHPLFSWNGIAEVGMASLANRRAAVYDVRRQTRARRDARTP